MVLNDRSRASITLRAATSEDAVVLHSWLNDPDRIASSLQTFEAVPLDRHISWLAARLIDPRCRIWVLETADGPAGQLRLDDSAQGAEVSVYVTREFRGRGIAAAALAAATAHARNAYSHGRLLARVRRDNAASMKLFTAAGFVIAEKFDDHFLLAHETCWPKEVDQE